MDTFDLRAYLKENRLLEDEFIAEFVGKDEIEKLIDKAVIEKEKDGVEEGLVAASIIALPVLLELGGKAVNALYRFFNINPSKSKKFKELNQKKKDIADEANLGIKIFGKRFKSFDLSKNDSPKEKEAKQKIANIEKQIDKELGTKLGDALVKIGHEVHNAYITPILLFLSGIAKFAPENHPIKKLETQKKIANIVYAAAMLVVAGKGVYNSLQHLEGVKEAATIMIELAEEGASLIEVGEAGLESVGLKDIIQNIKKT